MLNQVLRNKIPYHEFRLLYESRINLIREKLKKRNEETG